MTDNHFRKPRPANGESAHGRPDRKPGSTGGSEHRPQARTSDRASEHRPQARTPDRTNERRPQARPPDRTNSVHRTSPRDIALYALEDVMVGSAYTSQALDRHLKGCLLSEEDRRLCAAIFYTCIENRLRFDYILDGLMEKRPERMIWDILHIALAQMLCMDRIPDHAVVNEAVEQTRRMRRKEFAPLVNAVLRALIRKRDEGTELLPDRNADPEKYLSVRYSFSPFTVSALIAAYGIEEAEKMMAYSPARHTTVRFNTMKYDEASFERYLDGCGIEWRKGKIKGTYHLRGMVSIAEDEGFISGKYSVQGESSLLAAMAVKPACGMQILDTCAAPGGKTCYIAEAMQGTGRIYAWDLYPVRADLLRAAQRRLRLDNIRVSARDARVFLPDFEGLLDAVLIDAPCSGLGVISDKPDIRYKLTEKDLSDIISLQRGILDTCSSYVRRGGRLVYSTCTVLPEENCRQIEAFLAAHPEFVPDDDASFLPEEYRPLFKNGQVQFLPQRDGIDGFFIACLRRKG